MNVPSTIHVRMEERVPIAQEATSAHVMQNILEGTVKLVGHLKKLVHFVKCLSACPVNTIWSYFYLK